MSLVSGLEATLAGLVLFLVPGLLFLTLLAREEQERTPPEEALFLLLGVSVAFSSWVALGLGELAAFSLCAAASVVLALALLAAFIGRRKTGFAYGLARKGAPSLWPAGLVLLLALLLQARPSEYIVGGRDPGAYVAAMGLIARTGGIEYVDPLVLAVPAEDAEVFFRHPDKPQAFSWGRFMGFDLERPQTGRVYPEFFHLFPAFGAFLFAAMGVKGALATPVVFAVLGTLGVFVTLRRLLGKAPALLGSLLLCVCAVHVWFARYPVSETQSLFLYFLALFAFVRFEETESPAFAFLAGAALGLSLLVRIDAVLVVIPLGLYLGHRLVRHDLAQRPFLALILPFVLLAAHAVLHAVFFARKYFVQVLTRRYWNFPPEVWAAVAIVAVVSLLLLHWRGKHIAALVDRHETLLRRTGIALVVILAAYAYFLRPHLSAWAGGDGNDQALRWADPGVLLALGFRRLAAHDAGAFYRMGWFVTPLGLALGVTGFCLLIREGKRKHLFPGLFLATFAGFYFYKIRIWNDYYFALRRYVPVVLPFLLALAALALARLYARNARGRLLATGLTLALGALLARDTTRLWRFTDWKGSVDFVRDLSKHFSKDDAVIFEQPRSIHLLSLPLWAAYGTNALELARFNPDPDRLRHLLAVWRGRFKNVYFVHTPRTDLCGLFMERVQAFSFTAQEWERTYDRAPSAPKLQSLHFLLSRLVSPEDLRVPPLPEVDIGGSDDVVVSGFYDKEVLHNVRTYRWSGACGSIYFPGLTPGGTLLLTVSAGPRKEPVEVKVSVGGASLGSLVAGPTFETHSLPLPATLAEPRVLRLDALPWRPERDRRELGVMVDRLTAVPGPRATLSRSAQGGGAP